jgi:hypothetical protein
MKIKNILCVLLLIITGCGNSYELIEKVSIEKNRHKILDNGWAQFYGCPEYKNGMNMNPRFIFDKVIVFHLNANETNIDYGILAKSKFNEEWDGLSLDKDGLKNMIQNNIPIVQVAFHWWDPLSKNNNNGWYNYTYFYPEAKMENGKLNLGPSFRTDQIVDCLHYFPYFYESPSQMLMSSMGALFLDLKNEKSNMSNYILYNGNEIRISDILNSSSGEEKVETSDSVMQDESVTEVVE